MSLLLSSLIRGANSPSQIPNRPRTKPLVCSGDTTVRHSQSPPPPYSTDPSSEQVLTHRPCQACRRCHHDAKQRHSLRTSIKTHPMSRLCCTMPPGTVVIDAVDATSHHLLIQIASNANRSVSTSHIAPKVALSRRERRERHCRHPPQLGLSPGRQKGVVEG